MDVNLGSTSVGGVDWQLTCFRGLTVGPRLPLLSGEVRLARDCLGMKFEGMQTGVAGAADIACGVLNNCLLVCYT